MGARLNAVEVSDPETFLANGNKPAEFFTSLYCGERLRGMGCKGEQQWRAEAQRKSLPLWRMEDGFLRSSGLGSDLLPPLSLVLDKRGIYYDATRPSDLEVLLNHSQLTLAQKMRAEKLRQRLVESKLSKYNLGADFSLPAEAKDKKVILVPGQVEDDASIKTGTVSIKSNLELLRTVRERNPHAYIVYKPHPDVLVGNRKGDIPAELTAELADYQALDADIIQCIQRADEVHTMTSLSGFEALLHGKHVHCYGLPFYSGWGLTVDEHRCPRRERKLTLADLIYQALIVYPTYIHPTRLQPITVEEAAEYLIQTPRKPLFITRKSGASNTLLPQINYVLQGQIWLNNFIVDYYANYLCKVMH